MKYFILLLFVIVLISGCNGETKQESISFNIEDNVILNGNSLYFKYKDLECNADWQLKESENGLLTEADVDISDKIKFNKGVLTDLQCNKKLKCNKDSCETDKYYINLDPEVGEKDKGVESIPIDLYRERAFIESYVRDGVTWEKYDYVIHPDKFPYFVNKSGKLTNRKELTSLKDNYWNDELLMWCDVQSDNIDLVDCNDFNWSEEDRKFNVKLELQRASGSLSNVPLRKFSINETTGKRIYDNSFTKNVSFSSHTQQKEFNVLLGGNEFIEWGPKSTLINIKTNSTFDDHNDTYWDGVNVNNGQGIKSTLDMSYDTPTIIGVIFNASNAVDEDFNYLAFAMDWYTSSADAAGPTAIYLINEFWIESSCQDSACNSSYANVNNSDVGTWDGGNRSIGDLVTISQTLSGAGLVTSINFTNLDALNQQFDTFGYNNFGLLPFGVTQVALGSRENAGNEPAYNLTIEIASDPPTPPILNLPLDLAQIPYDTTLELNWSNITGFFTTPINYYLEVASDISFTNLLRVNTSISETDNTTETIIDGIQNGLAYWRVLSSDGIINSSWSETNIINFTTTNTLTLELYLDSISSNRNYEELSRANITAFSNETTVEFCISIDTAPYETDTCIVDNKISINYTVDAIAFKFNDSNRFYDASGTTSLTGFNIPGNVSEVDSASIYINGTDAQDIDIDFFDDGSIEISLVGTLNNNSLLIDKFNTTTSTPLNYTFLKSGNIIEHITVGSNANFSLANFTITGYDYFPNDPDITILNDSSSTKTITWFERGSQEVYLYLPRDVNSIDNAQITLAGEAEWGVDTFDSFANLTCGYDESVTLNCSSTQYNVFNLSSNSTDACSVTMPNGCAVKIEANQIYVDTGITINGNAKGNDEDSGTGKGSTGTNPPCGGGGGAGYGGVGGAGTGTSTGGSSYGTTSEDDFDIGSGGGSYLDSPNGGDGGGTLYLRARIIEMHGDISMNGENGEGSISKGAGGGSGGMIFLQGDLVNISDSLLEVKGGGGGSNTITHPDTSGCDVAGGGAGGGRIKTFYTTAINNSASGYSILGGQGGKNSQPQGGPLYAANGTNGTYTETQKSGGTYPFSPWLEVGVVDNDVEWNYTDSFNVTGNYTDNFTDAILAYYDICVVDNLSYCTVPLTFNSSTGSITISNINISVTSFPIPRFDVDNDDIDEYIANETLTSSKVIDLSYAAWTTASSACTTSKCEVPLKISSSDMGIMSIDTINLQSTIGKQELNTTYVKENIDKFFCRDVSCAYPLRVNISSGSAILYNLFMNYSGYQDIDITAKVKPGSNYSGEITKTISVKYSPYNLTYPLKLNTWELYPSNWTSYNITPYGQEIKWNNSNHSTGYNYSSSVPIFNITNNAEQNIIDVTVRLDERNLNTDCIDITLANSISKNDGIVLNSTEQIIVNDLSLANESKVFLWADFIGCNTSIYFWDPDIIFGSYCNSCIYLTDLETY